MERVYQYLADNPNYYAKIRTLVDKSVIIIDIAADDFQPIHCTAAKFRDLKNECYQ
jgi:hypothetical protein